MNYRNMRVLLSNITYTGKRKFGFEGKDKDTGKRVQNLPGEIFEGKHEAIIDIDTFNAVQEVIKHHTLKNMRITKTQFLLTGLIRHNKCSHRMYGKVKPITINTTNVVHVTSLCPLRRLKLL